MARIGRTLGVVAASALSLCCAGCELIGVMAASEQRYGSKTVAAEYTGLVDKSYAVVAWCDRALQAEWPLLLPSVMESVDARLAEHAGASGHVPATQVTDYLSNTPQWVAWPRSRLAEELGVERVVFIEINDFRTNEPGNDYLWEGLVWATLTVIEGGEGWTDTGSFTKEIRVTFPDGSGFGPEDFTRMQIASVLRSRVVDRASWVFYEHTERNAIEY